MENEKNTLWLIDPTQGNNVTLERWTNGDGSAQISQETTHNEEPTKQNLGKLDQKMGKWEDSDRKAQNYKGGYRYFFNGFLCWIFF